MTFNLSFELHKHHPRDAASQGLKTVAGISRKGKKYFALVDRRDAVIGGAIIGNSGATLIGNDAGSLVAAPPAMWWPPVLAIL